MALQYTVSFVTLATLNLDLLVKFYHHLFGFSPSLYIPKRYAEFQLSGLRLGIFQPQLDHATEFMALSGSKMSVCLEVENLEHAIAAIAATYAALSIQPGDRPILSSVMTTSHGREVYAYDIDGNRLILHEGNL